MIVASRRAGLFASAALLLTLVGLTGCGGSARPAAQAPPLAVGAPVLEQIRSGAKAANVVIVVLDAARADHVGCYGYPRHTTPNLDALAKESVVFRNHFSPIPSTAPSTASLLTGLYPDTHNFISRGRLDPSFFTLEGGLKKAGFQTALFTSNPNASPGVGIGSDFEHVFGSSGSLGKMKPERIGLPQDAQWETPEGLTRVFGEWLSRARRSRFFAYCHLLPPHNPYNAPDQISQALAADPVPPVQAGPLEFPEAQPPYGMWRPYSAGTWATLYDANLRWGDWGVGEIVRLLRQHDLLDNTLLIVTADHGEAFGEHGYIFHAHATYDEFVHIPLLIRFPGPHRLIGQVTALTQTVDVLPTILDLCRIPYPREQVQGRSLLPLLDGKQSELRDYVFARSEGPHVNYLVRNSAWSLIVFPGEPWRALYDLRRDPAQRHNVAAAHPGLVAKLTDAQHVFDRTQSASAPKAALAQGLSEKTRRELRALGYTQ